jgi:hypothetical protein
MGLLLLFRNKEKWAENMQYIVRSEDLTVVTEVSGLLCCVVQR